MMASLSLSPPWFWVELFSPPHLLDLLCETDFLRTLKWIFLCGRGSKGSREPRLVRFICRSRKLCQHFLDASLQSRPWWGSPQRREVAPDMERITLHSWDGGELFEQSAAQRGDPWPEEGGVVPQVPPLPHPRQIFCHLVLQLLCTRSSASKAEN